MAPPSRRGPSSSQPATQPGKAKDTASKMAIGNVIAPSTRESEDPVTRSFSGMSLSASAGATVNPYQNEDPRYKPKPGDITYIEPPPFSHPPPPQQSQRHPSAQSRRGASSSQQDIHPHPLKQSELHPSGLPRRGASSSQPANRSGKAKDGTDRMAISNVVGPTDPEDTAHARRGEGHKPPSPPEKAGQAKRRKGTTTSEVASSLQEEEAPEEHESRPRSTKVDKPPSGRKSGPKAPSWLPSEDGALEDAWKECYVQGMPPDWDRIWETMKREGFGHARNPQRLANRWSTHHTSKKAKTGPKPTPWLPTEVEALEDAWEECYGDGRSTDWHRIWETMKRNGFSHTRTPDDLKNWWSNHPSSKKLHPWLPTEEEMLIKIVKSVGNRWSVVSAKMKDKGYNRSANGCRTKFDKLVDLGRVSH